MWNPRPNEILHRLVRSQADSHTYSDFHDDFVGHEAIRRWFHYIKSSYILGTDMSAREVSRHFRTTAREYGVSTRHVVLRVDLKERAGWMPGDAWQWLHRQVDDS